MIRQVSARNAGPPAPRLASTRSRRPSAATASPRAGPDVPGAALAGSPGAGRADDRSDTGPLTAADDSSLGEHAPPGHPAGAPGTPALASGTRRNAPRGGRALSEQYITDGPPPRAGWYIYPASRAARPAGSAALPGRRRISRPAVTPAGYTGTAEHEQPAPRTGR
jgi:hypothetical protein